ncbi:MAG: 2Fe-2S iron-sulfur cluster-binding protein [Planctomycetota bacterium]|nr:2Fe-2S iron-sulfur cluster-binding protein [Planctomycetota bacterium]
MGGTNPYIDEAEYELPKKAYKVTINLEEEGKTLEFEVDPAKIPYNPSGLPGSILDIAEGAGIEIDHACGGVVACSTCHVVVDKGLNSCNEAADAEEDMLDHAPGLTLKSRLACQCVPNGTEDIVISIPDWNRNAAKEPPH